jgi:hypothetical protein
MISPSVRSVFKDNGHDQHQDGRDIIPPFTYTAKDGSTQTYPGLNWDAEGQAIFNAGCDTAVAPTDPKDRRTQGPEGPKDPKVENGKVTSATRPAPRGTRT